MPFIVRVSAKELTSLVLDEERLRAERHDRKLWKQRVTGLEDGYGSAGPTSPRRAPRESRRRQNNGDSDDDLEYKLAIEASKNQEEEDRKRRGGGGSSKAPETDDDLAKAIKLSKEEEDLRRRELENSNAQDLFDFDNTPSQPTQPQPTGFNNGYQQQGAVDWFGNPLMSQQTGMLNNAYAAQPTGMQQQQPMQTGFQNGYGGYNQFQQQPQQQQYQQQLQPQQTSFNMNNPYSQQNPNNFGSSQPQASLDQQPTAQPGTNNPWSTGSQSSSAFDSLKPAQTGSNNPFASSFQRPQTSSAAQRQPTLNTLSEQKQQNTFNQFSNMSLNNQPTAVPVQPAATAAPAQPQDPYRQNLNQLLASGEGQDTFGNTGDLRIPAQHTAPGTFVNSAGSGLSRINATQTGNNPFLGTQYTGMPKTQYPAQTGPVSGFGGSPSPFGQGQTNPYAQRQNQQGGANLIDF